MRVWEINLGIWGCPQFHDSHQGLRGLPPTSISILKDLHFVSNKYRSVSHLGSRMSGNEFRPCPSGCGRVDENAGINTGFPKEAT
jgi:hypothetical protein